MQHFNLNHLQLQRYKDWLNEIVVWIARFHDSINDYNAALPSPLTDKELHFVVIGAFGLGFFILSFLLFKLLTYLNRSGIMAWLFSFAAVLFVTFAIEMGQHMTNTGNMQLADIVYGVAGFVFASAGAAALYLVFCLLRRLFGK